MADTTASREEEKDVPPPIRVTLVPHAPCFLLAGSGDAFGNREV